MNNKLITVFLGIALLTLLPAYCLAGDIPASECPAVSALIAAGIKAAEHDSKYPTVWTAVNYEDHFGTENNWSLELEFIPAQTAEEAVAKANAVLNTMVFSGVDMFYCIYKGEYDGEEITGRAMKISGWQV